MTKFGTILMNLLLVLLRGREGDLACSENNDNSVAEPVCVGTSNAESLSQQVEVAVETSDQAIHCQATFKSSGIIFSISFIYAFNSAVGRRPLWENLGRFSSAHHNPWILLGDLNNVLSIEERANGQPVTMYEFREFKDCCYDLGLSDLRSTEVLYSWTNNTVWCKLDRAMVNNEWTHRGIVAQATLIPQGSSLITLPVLSLLWEKMIELCKKLKTRKGPLKSLNKLHFLHISARSAAAEEELQQAQQQLHNNPTDPDLQAAVPELRSKSLRLAEAEMSFRSQIAKAKFLKNIDKGTKVFHNLIKSRRMKSNIPSITLEDGTRSTSNKQVSDAFVQYYRGLLGIKRDYTRLNSKTVRNGKLLDLAQFIALTCPVVDEEIKSTLYWGGKGPGP
ncbi:uncharacterized protein LOC130788237 [Actinidia eriantha]|uniref:uncharacterized protein LOC130788237 n=1 Tax=Actinidia eriantha TaxID=165200 RepID=UPI002586D337|nr:uncharacterized protein LOC130788237 [Actinidia eriantha]